MPLSPASSLSRGLPLGLTGATDPTRYVGATASGEPASGTFEVGDFVIDQAGAIHVCTVAGSPGTWVEIGAGSGGLAGYALVREEQAQNTQSGTFTQDLWQTRVLNTEVVDTANRITLASNQMTMLAGTYVCYAICPCYQVGQTQARLQNVSDGATLLLGPSSYGANTNDANIESTIFGRFVLAATKTVELQHQCKSTKNDNGFGVRANITTEIFSAIEFLVLA